MDTDDAYLDDEFFVQLAGELPPDWFVEYRTEMVEQRDHDISYRPSPLRDTHVLGDDLPIDGIVEFYDPDAAEQRENARHFHFPFRSVEHECDRWFAFPDKAKWRRYPIWKWTNPDQDPHEHLTLDPSLGVGQPLVFHCWVRNGNINWL